MNLTIGLNSHQCLPITITLVWQIKHELAPDLLLSEKLMLWLVFTFAFHGLLQSSEFMSPSVVQYNPLVYLWHVGVWFTLTCCLTLQLKSSKTDPYEQGCLLLIAPFHHSVCAVLALRKYLTVPLVSGPCPLYGFQSGNYPSRAEVTSILLPPLLLVLGRECCYTQFMLVP